MLLYARNTGGALIKPSDTRKIPSNAMSAMVHQTNEQTEKIQEPAGKPAYSSMSGKAATSLWIAPSLVSRLTKKEKLSTRKGRPSSRDVSSGIP